MEKQKNGLADARRKRINLYKKIIVAIITASILIPVVFCVILVLKVNKLESEINLLIHQINDEALYTDLDPIPENSGIDLVYAAETSIENETEASGQIEETEVVSLKKKVYLTFDDGPSTNTDRILDILDQYYVKATFFVVGQKDEASKELYKRIVEEGHTLAMHSYSHVYEDIYASKEIFIADLEQLQTYLHELTGIKPTLYRFPGGSSNTISKVNIDEFITCLKERNISYFDWNVSSGDAKTKQLPKEEIIKNVMKDIPIFNSSIVLLHDASNKTSTVDALPQLIESLLDSDYDILPLNDTVKPVQHIKAE